MKDYNLSLFVTAPNNIRERYRILEDHLLEFGIKIVNSTCGAGYAQFRLRSELNLETLHNTVKSLGFNITLSEVVN